MPQVKSKHSSVIHERVRSGSELRRKKSKASSGAVAAMCNNNASSASASLGRTSSEGGCTMSASSCSAAASGSKAGTAASSPAGHDSVLVTRLESGSSNNNNNNTVPAFPPGTDHSGGGSLHAAEPSASGAAKHLLKASAHAPAPSPSPSPSPPPAPRSVYNAGRNAGVPGERKPSGGNMIRNNSFDSVNIHDGPQLSAKTMRESAISSDQQPCYPQAVSNKLERATDVQEGSGSMHHTRIAATGATHFSTGDMIQAQYSPGTDQLSTNSRGSGSSSAMHASLSSGSCLGSGESEQQHLCNAAADNARDAGSQPGPGGHDSLQMQSHTGIGCESLPATSCACFHGSNNEEQLQPLDGGHAKLGSQPGPGHGHHDMYDADVVQDQDSGTAADWNDGFWMPVGNDEDDHMMHLMASSSGSSGSRMMHASGQAFATGDHNSADRASSFLDSPGFPLSSSSQGFHSGSRGLPRTSVSPAGDILLSSCQMQSVPPAAQVADFCQSLLNVDLNQQQQQQLQGSSPMMMSSMMSDMSMSCNLDPHPMHYHHASSASSSPERMIHMDHHCNQSWMQNMDQWMDQGHSTQLSSSLVHHRDSPSVVVHRHSSMPMLGAACYTPQSAEQIPMSWSNYGNRASNSSPPPPHSYSNYGLSPLMTSLGLPTASDLISGHPGSGSYMQFGVGVTPTRSLGISDMSGLHGFGVQHHQPGHGDFPSYMHTTGHGSSPLHAETDKAAVGGSMRRHSPAMKRSLSFMQSTDEDAEGSSPSSTSGKACRLTNASNGGPASQSTSPETSTTAADATTPPGPAAAAVGGLKLGIGSGTTAAGDSSVAKPVAGSTCFRPGIDDAAAQLSALLYTKSRTDIGNNAISQYHKLAFQNSFYNTSKLDNPSSTSCVSSGVGLGAKNAARRRHGTATDPQSIAARTRRERFSDRIRILQSLVPNGERLDTVSMLGQTLEYVRFLQQQVWQLYNGTSTPLSASAHGAAGGASASTSTSASPSASASAAAATNLAAQVASAESLAASFLSNMAQRQAAASAAAATSTAPAAEPTTKLAAGHGHGHSSHPGGPVDKWKQLAGNGSGLAPHVPAECTPVA